MLFVNEFVTESSAVQRSHTVESVDGLNRRESPPQHGVRSQSKRGNAARRGASSSGNNARLVPPVKSDELNPEAVPFAPVYIYDALRRRNKFDSLRGRQEDAEEFLSALLDGLHEEFNMMANMPERNEMTPMQDGQTGG